MLQNVAKGVASVGTIHSMRNFGFSDSHSDGRLGDGRGNKLSKLHYLNNSLNSVSSQQIKANGWPRAKSALRSRTLRIMNTKADP